MQPIPPFRGTRNNWTVLSDEHMSNGWPFFLLNDEQMSNKVGVEHQPDNHWTFQVWLSIRHLSSYDVTPRLGTLEFDGWLGWLEQRDEKTVEGNTKKTQKKVVLFFCCSKKLGPFLFLHVFFKFCVIHEDNPNLGWRKTVPTSAWNPGEGPEIVFLVGKSNGEDWCFSAIPMSMFISCVFK